MTDQCVHPEHQDADRVDLVLLMQPEKAIALVSAIDTYKTNGNIGVVMVNVMNIVGVSTTGDAPEGQGWRTVNRRGPQTLWWPINSLLLVLYGLAGYGLSMLDLPWRAWIFIFIVMTFVAPQRRWRWRLKSKAATDA